jgi:hypothetical protein
MTWGSLSGAALGALGFLVSPFTGIAGLAAGALGGSLIGYSRHRNEPRNNVDAAGGLVHSKKNQLLQLEDYLEHSLKKSVSRTDLRDGYSQSVRVTPRDGWKHGYARCEEVYCMTLPYAVSESGILTADDTCEFATFRLSVVNAVPQLLECYIEDHWSGGVPVIDYAPVHPDPVQVVVGAPKMGGGMLPFFVEKGLFEAFAESVKNYVTFDYVAIPLRTGSLTEAL